MQAYLNLAADAQLRMKFFLYILLCLKDRFVGIFNDTNRLLLWTVNMRVILLTLASWVRTTICRTTAAGAVQAAADVTWFECTLYLVDPCTLDISTFLFLPRNYLY